MWQTFWDYNYIYITLTKFSISKIIFTMLRQKQQTPEFSVIMPEKQDMGILDGDI